MRSLIGAVLVALGVVLVIYGLDATECLTTRISKMFHTLPGAKSVYILGLGVATVLLGMSMAYQRRGHGTKP